MPSHPPAPPQPRKSWFGSALRFAIPAAVLGYLFWRADVREVATALTRIPVRGLLGALLCTTAAMLTGVIRWRALLIAYGAQRVPRARPLVRWYFASIFYNLLPGSVGGDVMRGYATRSCFHMGAVSSLSVVFVERVLGFAGLLLLTAIASCFSPYAGPEVLRYSLLGLAIAVCAMLALAFAQRLSHWAPAPIAKHLGALPSLVVPSAFVGAVAWSVAAHLLLAASGHVLVSSFVTLSWIDSFVVFPLATLAAFFPLTVAGAGARDTALVLLLGRIGVPEADALACSLAMLFCSLAMAALGALLGQPRDEDAGASADWSASSPKRSSS